MTSGTDPPIYVGFVVFDDNLSKFREVDMSLALTVEKWLKLQFDSLPFVISPLHTPKSGKSHIHGIIELSPFQPIDFISLSKTFKAFELPRPELINNIFSAENYLTHDTPQSRIEDKQIFTLAEKQTMIFANGYKMHKQTARSKADDISLVVSYITENLYIYIKSNPYFDIDDLYCQVRCPEFYNTLETSLPFDLVVSKGKNEIRTHYRFYLQIGSELKKKSVEKPLCSEMEKFMHLIISNALAEKDDKILHHIHYSIWCNMRQYRELLAHNGNSHALYARNLRLAVNYFKNNENDLKQLYRLFIDVIEKR